jgi:hypothetical protein
MTSSSSSNPSGRVSGACLCGAATLGTACCGLLEISRMVSPGPILASDQDDTEKVKKHERRRKTAESLERGGRILLITALVAGVVSMSIATVQTARKGERWWNSA